ncbi:3-isopropylmalate dehydratase small subunit [Sphingomonas sp. HITSZ_GF]|uniref:3-isopropylmalate dehydratase small subunit n=1 Tax=Sphingomonas sp. HITSZ_GF TaxID=3037247 RepID=UPI00240D6798|nr:3-isopropylmalate dehydratase small subunit [Sphingomonas sp. HITSZ_GF]MDG2532169.1 3-isopropylmalate dehydratase small subunit [Sphingomonas sp. HITSZ_GF]
MSSAPFRHLTAIGVPLLRDNVDTDAIIPSREMKSVSKHGLSDGLFAGWRYTEVGGRTPDGGFILNQAGFAVGQILVSGANFGCGSSREHAAWALAEYGFRAILASSFNPIFRGNCVRNGIVPVELPQDVVAGLAAFLLEGGGTREVTVDLENNCVSCALGEWRFALEEESRQMLLEGLDAIDLTLRAQDRIAAFRDHDRVRRAWAYL